MTDDLKDEINQLNIRLVKLESQGDHHSTRIVEFREKHTDLDEKLDKLRDKVDSSTAEILKLIAATQGSIQSLRSWFIGITVGGGAVFAIFKLLTEVLIAR